MSRKSTFKTLSLATGTALAMGISTSALAEGNPFGATELPQGFMVASSHGDAGEAKCGGMKGEEKAAESKCGGMKGEEKAAESKCGGMKSEEKAAESKCGGMKEEKAAPEAKCGEGKCGGMKK